MAHIIRSGKAAAGRIGILTTLFCCISGALAGAPTCTYTATIPILHAEGLAEQISDITVTCAGGVGTTTTILIVTLNANITNRLDANGNITNVVISGGATIGAAPVLTTPNTVLFDGLQVPEGAVSFTVSGIRVAVPTVAGGGSNAQINATVVANTIGISGPSAAVGVGAPTLLASVLNYGVPCTGSPLSSTIDFPSLLAAGTSSSAIRITQASPGVFLPRTGTADFGVRFLVTLSGYGSNSTVYVPDVITGNQAPIQTSAGQFNTTAGAGTFTPNNNQMLLSRVVNADATGAGGTPFLAAVPM